MLNKIDRLGELLQGALRDVASLQTQLDTLQKNHTALGVEFNKKSGDLLRLGEENTALKAEIIDLKNGKLGPFAKLGAWLDSALKLRANGQA